MARQMALLAVIVSSVLLASAQADEKTEADLKTLSGKWKLTQLETEGAQLDLPATEDTNLIAEFKEGKILHKDGEVFSFKLDASVTPCIIDVTKIKDPEKGQLLEGIYKLDGDTLTICLWTGQGTRARPADFTTKAGSNFALAVLKKQ